MIKKREDTIAGQMSVFDWLDIVTGNRSSSDIEAMIVKLNDTKKRALEREQGEKRREEEKKRRVEAKRRKKEEHINEVTSMDLPLDWNNVFDTDERTQGVHADTPSDALILSLTTLGRVDIEYISSITGMDYKDVIYALKGSIYQNPDTWNECFYKGWETSDEYLSGNLKRKWKSAIEADGKYNGYFSENIAAIEKVLPPSVATKDIYVTLGSPWVPADVIDDFIIHLFGKCKARQDSNWTKYHWKDGTYEESIRTRHDDITGTWEIPNKNRYNQSVAVSQIYGTKHMEALEIIEKTLNMRTIVVTENTVSLSDKRKKVVNKRETVAANEKQRRIIEKFQKWIWSDPDRRDRLEIIYENNYGCVRRRIFDGSFLTFPTMSTEVNLYPYQKDAVARIIFTPNTLLAHDVGSGKTYVMIAAGQELRRMGLSKKNMYVVPNNIVTQWKDIFLTMYPGANVLCIDPKVFKPEKRQRVLQRIIDEDFDGIIIAYSCFEMIPLSREYYREILNETKKNIEETLQDEISKTARLKKRLDKIAKLLNEIPWDVDDIDLGICFDDLKINRLFIDEAHNFKNVPIDTKVDAVLGINTKGSSKCQDMMGKVHMVQRANDGKGVVMATGMVSSTRLELSQNLRQIVFLMP